MDSEQMGAADIRPLLRKPLTRRAMISVLGTGTLAAVAAACGTPAPSPTTAPAATAAATKPAAAPSPAATTAATTAPAAGTAAATKPAAVASPAATTAPVATTAPAAPPAATTAAMPKAATGPIVEGATLVMGMWQEPDTLHPYLTNMTYSIWINQWINTEMIKTGKEDKLAANLLKEVPTLENGGISRDGLTYKVTFKDGLKWSDGQPLTGEDLVYTWKFNMDPKSGVTSTSGWDQINDIELSADKLTATIRLKDVWVPFIGDVLTYSASSGGAFLLPAHYFKDMPADKVAQDPYAVQGGSKYVGAGPYKVVEWKKGVSLTVEPNPNWFGPKPKLGRVIFSFVGSREKQVDGLRTGDLDYAVDFIEAQIPDLEKLPESVVFPSAAAGTVERYYFNMWEPGSDKTKPHRLWGGADGVQVRKAVAMAMNRQAVVDKILFGKTTVAVGEMDNIPTFKPNLKPIPYDAAQAEKMLDELGWKKGADGIREKNGVKFEFVHSTTSGNVTRETIQRAFIADLEKVGIRMKIQNFPPAEMFATFANNGPAATGKIDMWGWTTGSTDPSIYRDLLNSDKIPTKEKSDGNNYIGYKNAKMDELTNKQASAVDPKERKALVDQIHQMIIDEVPILYVYNRLNVEVAKNYVAGVEPYPAARFMWNSHEWGLTKKR